jgi:predicted enzyme related to lactoylglutathione lyase
MEKVTGIGGVFFKSRDPKKIGAWYQEHLGIQIEDWGGSAFRWREHADHEREASTVWSPFADDTEYFQPSEREFMVNYRVRNLDAMLAQLREAGVEVDDRIEESEFGRFGWCQDPDGTRIELWEPPEGL